jgi:hypothetical protein
MASPPGAGRTVATVAIGQRGVPEATGLGRRVVAPVVDLLQAPVVKSFKHQPVYFLSGSLQ